MIGDEGGCSDGIDPIEFAQTIADELYDLEGRKHAPRVLPYAIRAFGLEPRSKLIDIAAVEDIGVH